MGDNDRSTTAATPGGGISRRDFLRGTAAAALAVGGASSVLLEPTLASAAALAPRKGGSVIEGWATDIKTFNSILSQDVYSNMMINLVNDPLLFVNSKGLLEPGLATSVPTGGSDGTPIRSSCTPGVKWTDGTPLTSDDVLFTYNLIFAPEYSAVASPRRGDFTLHVDSISAPDPETFVIHTKSTYAPLLYSHGAYPIMPKHVLGSIPAAADQHHELQLGAHGDRPVQVRLLAAGRAVHAGAKRELLAGSALPRQLRLQGAAERGGDRRTRSRPARSTLARSSIPSTSARWRRSRGSTSRTW